MKKDLNLLRRLFRNLFQDFQKLLNNQVLAEKLGISIDEVLDALDFFELCHLIEKHRPQGAEVWDFSGFFFTFSA